MEIRNKLNLPSGSVHDIRYLYAVIAALKQKNGRLESNNKTFEYFKRMINDYNVAKVSKYGLSSKPREVNLKVIRHIIAELKYLNIIQKEKRDLVLTNDGVKLAELIENKSSNQLKGPFTILMLENFKVFRYFLKRIKEVSNGKGVPIPFITSATFDNFNSDPIRIAERYVNIINQVCPDIIKEPAKLYQSLECESISSLEKRTDKISKLQAVIERFVVSEAFGPNITSRRVYDFVRFRTTFLDLTNYAGFNYDEFPAETAYLTCDFEPTFHHYTKIDLSGGDIYINYPVFDEIRLQVKDTIAEIYKDRKDDFGYIKIADVRDMACRKLRISDRLFNEYLKKLYKQEPHWLSFTYSGAGDKITEKRLPIIFEKPTREFFTLLTINLRG